MEAIKQLKELYDEGLMSKEVGAGALASEGDKKRKKKS
jgi:hypothetical protein